MCIETTFHVYRNDFQCVSKRLFMCIETTSICIETTCIETTLYRNDRTPYEPNWSDPCQVGFLGFLTLLCSFAVFVSLFDSFGPEKPH